MSRVMTRPDPRDFENLLTQPDLTREILNLLTRPDLNGEILKPFDPTRPDPRDFETS